MNDTAQDIQYPPDDDFYEAVRKVTKIAGCMAIEQLTCSKCEQRQISYHHFVETVKCGTCGHPMPTTAPRKPVEGEVNGDMLTLALLMMRRAYPAPDEATEQWVAKQEGAVKAVAMVYAAGEVRRVLDGVRTLARSFSKGHTAI